MKKRLLVIPILGLGLLTSFTAISMVTVKKQNNIKIINNASSTITKNKVDKISKEKRHLTVNNTPKSRSSISFRTQANQYNENLLKTFGNEKLYTDESYNNYSNALKGTEYKAILSKLKDKNQEFTKSDYNVLVSEWKKISSILVSYKETLDKKVFDLNSVPSNIYTPESYAEFTTQLNKEVNKITGDINIDKEKRSEYDKELDNIKALLITYKFAITKKIDDLNKRIMRKINLYTPESANEVTVALRKLRSKIGTNEIGKTKFEELENGILDIKNKIVLKEPETKIINNNIQDLKHPMINKVDENVVAFSIIASLTFLIAFLSYIISKILKRRRKNKNQIKNT